jgi:ubiquinone/menaquinone biosynthesis C-methylase UbiE
MSLCAVNTTESKYIEKKGRLSHLAYEQAMAERESKARLAAEFGSEAEWLQRVQEDFTKFIPFLTQQCGVEFCGRILEIGAGAAWFSAELSKLPNVVEVYATDVSPKVLKEQAPKMFKLLGAQSEKITRMPADPHQLDFPDNHFDFVVCAGVLHRAVNLVELLSEARRVLKPGGRFVAIREPVWPLVKLKSRALKRGKAAGVSARQYAYTLVLYREFFAQAGLSLDVKRVNLSSGFKYYFNQVVNGLMHARYAFVATKKTRT